MLRKALLQGLLLISGLTVTLAVPAASTLVSDPPMIAGAPFSGVMEVQSTTAFSDGNRIVRTNSVRYFRDGQGRTRTEREGLSLFQGAPPLGSPVILIKDPVSGERVTLLPKLKVATQFKLSGGLVSVRAAVADCNQSVPPFALLGLGMGIGADQSTEASTSTTSLGDKQINGLNVTGSRIVRTIPVGVLGNEKPITSTVEQWISSDLGMIVQFSETSSVGGSVTLSLNQIVRGEPDPTLFSIPTDYKVQNFVMPEPLATSSSVADGSGTITFSNSSSVTAVSSSATRPN
jgi:hypothetical protein